ncbi:MAG: 6-phosphogluconolactonase [Actinomycetota bacterium]|nr:6-phosphogluconolactonase [Actinomycetota bacterium]
MSLPESGPAPEVVVEPSATELAAATADRLLALISAALRERSRADLLITGGGILERVLRAVGAAPARDSIDWRHVHIWWGDERYVEAQSDDRNDKAAFAALLGSLDLDPAHVHRMPASDWGFADVDEAAAAYARQLAASFDVALLGVGPDGHCASLFPTSRGVYEESASVIGVHDSPKPPPLRISLTFRSLDTASEVWFIASGSPKSHAVGLAVGGADRALVPSAGPRGRSRTLWLLDTEAAAELPSPT